MNRDQELADMLEYRLAWLGVHRAKSLLHATKLTKSKGWKYVQP
jgi:hypothetical protein